MEFEYLKQPPKRYTFEQPKLKKWVEKTIQETQYEPKKISVFISKYVDDLSPERIKAMLKMAENIVMEKSKKAGSHD